MDQSYRVTAWYVSRFAFLSLLLTLACCGSAQADTWSTGQVSAYSQGDWADPIAPAGILLQEDYNLVYPSGILQVGAPAAGFSMTFTDAVSVETFLPASGSPNPLTASLFDPTDSSSGVFGGDILALQLDVDFSDAGFLVGSSEFRFGDLILANLTGSYATLNGLSVREFLADANRCFGGGACVDGVPNEDAIAGDLTFAFDSDTPTLFAQLNLIPPGGTAGGGGGMTPTPEPSSALLFAIGMLGLGVICYKRRANRAVS